MNITKLDIKLDKEGCIYEPGEEISGQVLMRLESPQKARGLRITINGNCCVHWLRTETVQDMNGSVKTRMENVTASEQYINWTEYLIGRKDGPKMKFPAGEQSYPFSFRLPRKIPNSFKHDYGNVVYTLKAVVDLPYRTDHEVTKGFNVVSKLDLNTVPEAANGIDDERAVSFCNIFCCSFGEINVRIRLPTRGYVPGQYIIAAVSFDNRSFVEIEKIKLNFIQIIKFKVPSNSEIRIEKRILENSTLYGPFDQNDEFDMSISVGSVLASSYFRYCKLIDIDYILNIKYVIYGCYSNISNSYQIIIGTIPLITAQSEWSTTSVPVEAAKPSAPYLPEPEVPVAPYPPGPEMKIALYPTEPEVPVAPYPSGPEMKIAPYPPEPEVPVAPYPPGPEMKIAPYPPEPEVPVAPYPSGPEVKITPCPPEPQVTVAPYPPGPEMKIAPYPPQPLDQSMPINYQPMPQNYKLGFENYKPGTGERVTGMPFVVPVPGPSTLPIGFVLPPEFPPPSYEECTTGSHPVDQKQEPNSDAGVKQPLIPPYPLVDHPYKSN